MAEHGNGVTYTVKELLEQLDKKIDERFDAIEEKFDAAIAEVKAQVAQNTLDISSFNRFKANFKGALKLVGGLITLAASITMILYYAGPLR